MLAAYIQVLTFALFGIASVRSKDEETLESVFYNQLFGYNFAGRDGRWISLPLKRKKKMGGGKRKKKPALAAAVPEAPRPDEDGAEAEDKMDQDGAEEDEDFEMAEGQAKPWEVAKAKAEAAALAEDDDPDDPEKVSATSQTLGGLRMAKLTKWCGGTECSDGAVQHDARDSAQYTLPVSRLRFALIRTSVDLEIATQVRRDSRERPEGVYPGRLLHASTRQA